MMRIINRKIKQQLDAEEYKAFRKYLCDRVNNNGYNLRKLINIINLNIYRYKKIKTWRIKVKGH